MEDIESGLHALAQEISQRNIRSIALPPLGSGLGGLQNGPMVKSRIEAVLQEFDDLRVIVFEPGGVPSDDRANRSTDVPKMTQSRAVLIDLMHRYLSGLLIPVRDPARGAQADVLHCRRRANRLDCVSRKHIMDHMQRTCAMCSRISRVGLQPRAMPTVATLIGQAPRTRAGSRRGSPCLH